MPTRLLTAAALATLAATPLVAQSNLGPCGERDYFVDKLSETYAEEPVAGGLQSEDSLVEIWASEETGTFTILVTDPSGLSCVAFTGDTFQKSAPLQAVKGEAS